MAASQFDAQRAVRMDAEQLNEYMQDLFNWSKDMKRKERAKPVQQAPAAAASGERASGQAPSLASHPQRQQQQQQQQSKDATRHPAAHTYDHYSRKWDRFDVDAALAEDEAEGSASAAASTQQTRLPSGNGTAPGSSRASQPVAIPQARVTVPVGPGKPAAAAAAGSGAAPTTADCWKDAGNAHFKRGRHREAVDCYSRSLELQPSCLAFANRAMARLKLGHAAEAEADCSQAVALDPLYVKAYQRRATARRQLGELLGAVDDCESALRLEPNNKQAAEDRAACVAALLQQEGLQPPTRTEWLPVVLADAAGSSAGGSSSGVAEGGAVEPLGAPECAKVQPAEPAGDALISVAAVKRLKPATTAGTAAGAAAAAVESAAGAAAAAVEPAARGAARPARQQGAAERPRIAVLPIAGASASTADDQAVPDAAQARDVMPTAEQRQPAAQQPPAAQHAQPSVAPAAPVAAAPATFKPPRTGLEFEKAWKGLKGDRQLQAAYLLALQPAVLPTLLRQALSPGLLAAAAAALLRPGMQQAPAPAVGLLEGLAQVPRFDLNLLSVPPRQRAELAADWDAAAAAVQGQAGGEGEALAGRLAAVRQRYKL